MLHKRKNRIGVETGKARSTSRIYLGRKEKASARAEAFLFFETLIENIYFTLAKIMTRV